LLKVLIEKRMWRLIRAYGMGGVAVFKKTYNFFGSADTDSAAGGAFRNHMHWSELIGGDLWFAAVCVQVRLNKSDIEVVRGLIGPWHRSLWKSLAEVCGFQRAYTEKGISIAEFDSFGRHGER